jgi:lipopolysaccharide transport system permease protein
VNFQRMRDLVIVLTQKELKARYKHMKLGYLWSLGNPLAYGLIYWLVFKFVMKVKIEGFPLFLVSGLFPWQWFVNSIGVSANTFVGNASLIKKVNFPRNLLSLVVSTQDLIHFLAALPIIFGFMLIYQKPFSPLLLVGVPALAMIQLLYTYSLGLIVSTVNIFFRDAERLIGIFITFLFYLTPIVYNLDMVPEEFRKYVILNPLAPLILNWRGLFLEGNLNGSWLVLSTVYGLFFLVMGQWIYKKLSWRFAEVL